MSKIRVLLADDHQAVRERVSALLGEDFEVVGTADNGREAVVATQRLDPDILVIDISMPILNGLATNRNPRERSSFPGTFGLVNLPVPNEFREI